MLRAIYVRTLKEGVSDDDYIAAWLPEGTSRDDYPGRVTVSHSTVNERDTVTTIEFDGDPERILEEIGALVRADWRDRVAEVVEGTTVETIFEETAAFGTATDLRG